MNTPLAPMKPDAHRRMLIGDMGRALVEYGIDLGDERAAILALRRRHREGDIVALLDDAIAHARGLSAQHARPGA